MSVCGTVIVLLLSEMVALLVLGLSREYWMLVLASPTFVIGAVVWWIVVERRDSYTYLLGGAFGLVTALLTGLLWTGYFVLVWGVEMATIPVVAFLIAFVLGVVAVAGALAAIPLLYVRRRSTCE